MSEVQQPSGDDGPSKITPVETKPIDHRAARQAVQDTFLATLPPETVERVRRRFPALVIVSPENAFVALGNVVMDPLFKLHAVASGIERQIGLANDGVLEAMANVVVSALGIVDRGGVVEGLRQFAGAAGRSPGGLTRARWNDFRQAITSNADYTFDNPVYVAKPGCNDDEVARTAAGDARVISSRFWTNKPLPMLADFIRPENWPVYGSFLWEEMKPVAGLRQLSPAGSYQGVFNEVVRLPMGVVTVFLDVQYLTNPTFARTTYRLATGYPNAQVTVDAGYLLATTDTVGPPDLPTPVTLVEGHKAIRFRDNVLNDLPELACDCGWVDYMINMALDQPNVPLALASTLAASDGGSGGIGGYEAVAANVGGVIDDWVDMATASIRGHGDAAKTVVGRVVSPSPDPRWINDVVGMGDGVVTSAGETIKAWRSILRELESMGGWS
jgi:hypothetical protein